MSITRIVEYLNRSKGYNIQTNYYTTIQTWRDWWRGYHEPFHSFKEQNGETVRTRELYSLKMAKKVCEDWASVLLNERTLISVDDSQSQMLIIGDNDNEQSRGVLGDNDFWEQGNNLVEKGFATGTGAFIVRVEGMLLRGDRVQRNPDARIIIDYLDASHIIPLTIKGNRIVECAFASEVTERGETYTYLETHELTDSGYRITNQYFETTNGALHERVLPDGMTPEIITGSSIPLFSIFYPNVANTVGGASGLGMSVFANSIDNLKGVDLAFNNFNRDFVLGGKKVFYNDSLVRTDINGKSITPDDVMQQLFVQVAEASMHEDGKNKLVHEFNPSLRVSENRDGIQAQLDYLSFKCGFGTKHYQFNGGTIVTATQYSGDKQELMQNAAKHYIVMERALQGLCRAILWAGREILGLPVDPDANIAVTFDDSFVIDKESERLRDLQEVRDGLMQKWEYRAKWYGEDEETARSMIAGTKTDSDWMGFE